MECNKRLAAQPAGAVDGAGDFRLHLSAGNVGVRGHRRIAARVRFIALCSPSAMRPASAWPAEAAPYREKSRNARAVLEQALQIDSASAVAGLPE